MDKLIEEIENQYSIELDTYTDMISRGTIESIINYQKGKISAYEYIINLIKSFIKENEENN